MHEDLNGVYPVEDLDRDPFVCYIVVNGMSGKTVRETERQPVLYLSVAHSSWGRDHRAFYSKQWPLSSSLARATLEINRTVRHRLLRCLEIWVTTKSVLRLL